MSFCPKMHPAQFRFDTMLKHPLADSYLKFHWTQCHDSKVLFLHSQGHSLLMWRWLASLTCCGGREPYMPLQEDRSLRQCWRWTAPASGRCHHSLRRREHSSRPLKFCDDTKDMSCSCDWAGRKEMHYELTYRTDTNGWMEAHTQSHTQTSTHNLH